MARMTIFHGGYVAIEKPEIRAGRYTKDFGPAFYCTVIREQAERWARRFSTPVINVYSTTIKSDLKILEFDEPTDRWLDFIVNCRHGISHDYDIVIGAMADDQIYNYIEDFLDGSITREQFWVLAKFRYPTHQIAFCSEAALECVQFVRAEAL